MEIRLFRLTKLLYALFHSEEQVKRYLDSLLGKNDWKIWLDRFNQLNSSKETQIILMRRLGYTYRDIQNLLNVSPNKIQLTLNTYDLTYETLQDYKHLEPILEEITKQLEREGIKIW